MSDQSVEIRVGRAVQVQVFHAEFVDGLESIDLLHQGHCLICFSDPNFIIDLLQPLSYLVCRKKIIWMSKAAHLYTKLHFNFW